MLQRLHREPVSISGPSKHRGDPFVGIRTVSVSWRSFLHCSLHLDLERLVSEVSSVQDLSSWSSALGFPLVLTMAASLLISWITAPMQTCTVPLGAESSLLAPRRLLSPAAAQLWGRRWLGAEHSPDSLLEHSCWSWFSNLQQGCISQWVRSTLHGVCSYSAVGNLCSVLLCVELDIAWFFFFFFSCLSSITVLAGYILKQILHTWIYSLEVFLH